MSIARLATIDSPKPEPPNPPGNGAICLVERGKQSRLLMRIDPHAGVTDRKFQGAIAVVLLHGLDLDQEAAPCSVNLIAFRRGLRSIWCSR